ncbi:secreted RxLR effector protein 78-like [Rutidosis leptorrhynchoides]|uniref:secreted RxLR effector protein 78-like n=1 Tax=Rutidosis leptorrhynchoides TaxID=125765 RepID=UPI003A9A3C11
MDAKKKKGIIFKVDFEKAFDSLNWCFLFEVMKCTGFGSKWIKWIESCLKSAFISILINGSPTKHISLGRGVRQGDPLSPFLFISAVEGLNILTKVAIENGLFKGVEVGDENVGGEKHGSFRDRLHMDDEGIVLLGIGQASQVEEQQQN